jgi:hypothetical protein
VHWSFRVLILKGDKAIIAWLSNSKYKEKIFVSCVPQSQKTGLVLWEYTDFHVSFPVMLKFGFYYFLIMFD